jgi:hypothetical protein
MPATRADGSKKNTFSPDNQNGLGKSAVMDIKQNSQIANVQMLRPKRDGKLLDDLPSTLP